MRDYNLKLRDLNDSDTKTETMLSGERFERMFPTLDLNCHHRDGGEGLIVQSELLKLQERGHVSVPMNLQK